MFKTIITGLTAELALEYFRHLNAKFKRLHTLDYTVCSVLVYLPDEKYSPAQQAAALAVLKADLSFYIKGKNVN
jgi:hypothetical protein